MKYAIIQNEEFVGATEAVVVADGVELLAISDEVFNDINKGVEFVYVDGEIKPVKDCDNVKAINKMKEDMRQIRNEYLTDYVDPKQLFLVWGSLSVDDKGFYIDYRKYLLDYPESSEDWYKNAPLTPEEWKKATERY